LVALALAARLYRITAPLTDLRAMRQTHTAAIARDCYRRGFNPLRARPDAIGFPRTNFPLYPSLISLEYGLAGGVHEWLGRLTSLVVSVATVYMVFCIARLFWGRRAAIWAAFFFALTPASIFFGRAFMPEAMMMFLMASAFYGLSVWNVRGSRLGLILGAVCVGLAVTVKLTPIVLLLPAAWLLFERGRWRALFGAPGWVLALCTAAPLVLWYIPYLEGGPQALEHDWRPGLATLHYYLQMLINRPGGVLLGPMGYVAFLVGLLAGVVNRRDYAMHVWVVAAAVYLLKYAKVNFALEYYNLPFLPVGCLLAGRGMSVLLSGDALARIHLGARLRQVLRNGLGLSLAVMYLGALVAGYLAELRWEQTHRMPTTSELVLWGAALGVGSLAAGYLLWGVLHKLDGSKLRVGSRGLALTAVALTAATSVAYLGLMYRQRPDLLAAARTLARVSGPGDKVIEATDKSFVVLYYADRRGWYRFRKHFRPKQIEVLRGRGAAWFATTLLDVFEGDEELKDYLQANYRLVARTQHIVVFDLRSRLAKTSADPARCEGVDDPRATARLAGGLDR